MKCIVLGLGNPVLSDDSVGLKVAQRLLEKVDRQDVDIVETTAAGLDFLEILAGYDKAIFIDAIQTPAGPAGKVYRLELDALAGTRHGSSPHDVSLCTALELGKRLQLELPREIVIFAVEAANVITLSETCTPAVEAAIPACVDLVIEELGEAAERGVTMRMAGYSVLIVDDERIVGESLRDLLTDSGARVWVADSGEEALKILSIQEFDLLIIDYRLPGMDGLATLHMVKSLKYATNSILITAYPSGELEAKARQAGAAGFFTKPIDLPALEEFIQNLLFNRKTTPAPLS